MVKLSVVGDTDGVSDDEEGAETYQPIPIAEFGAVVVDKHANGNGLFKLCFSVSTISFRLKFT